MIFHEGKGDFQMIKKVLVTIIVSLIFCVNIYAGDTPAIDYFNRGNAYYILGQHQKAIDDYTRAIELDPKLAEAYCNRGIAYSNLGQYQKAIDNFTRAIKLNPKHAFAYYIRGVTYGK